MYYLKNEKKHFKYSTNLKIIPIDWNFKSNCPLKKRGAPGKGAKELSTKLKLIQLIFEKIILTAQSNNEVITYDFLKIQLNKKLNKKSHNHIESSPYISDYIEKFIEKRKNQKDIKNQTTRTSEGCLSNRVLFRTEIFGL